MHDIADAYSQAVQAALKRATEAKTLAQETFQKAVIEAGTAFQIDLMAATIAFESAMPSRVAVFRGGPASVFGGDDDQDPVSLPHIDDGDSSNEHAIEAIVEAAREHNRTTLEAMLARTGTVVGYVPRDKPVDDPDLEERMR